MTIITVTYNAGEYLEQTIQSVISQTYDNLEYIILDGGSTDSTIDIIKKYENSIAYWCSEPDKGIYDAMNKGIAISRGDIIGLINAGDTYLPNILESLAKKYLPTKNLAVYYG
ncbi:MAG: glycosyltransferase [Calothrix sp. SM1_7_51]|nr:glycosyltransferase [Calothrix sp. SM1_7_51]